MARTDLWRSSIARAVALLVALALSVGPANAAPVTSKCLAIAQQMSSAVPVAYSRAALEQNQVRLTFVGHSTFLIESAQGIRIATDYAGFAGPGVIPDVVTMNRAHETHYTDHPDPAIRHVLRGWNPDGGWAEHSLTVGDVFIRNVPTNIRTWEGGGTEKFGNSIFIFEVGGLCIGHLGHLHHELTDQQLGQLGQLDVVLAPVDGTFTLDHDGMVAVLKALRARLVIPMHFLGSLESFVERLSQDFAVRRSESATVILSPATLPRQPEVLVLPGF